MAAALHAPRMLQLLLLLLLAAAPCSAAAPPPPFGLTARQHFEMKDAIIRQNRKCGLLANLAEHSIHAAPSIAPPPADLVADLVGHAYSLMSGSAWPFSSQ